MQAKRPAILDQKSHYILKFALQRGQQVRPGFEKVFKVGRREHQHFPRPVHAIEIVTFAWPGHLDPARKVVDFLFGPLRKQVVSNPDSQLATFAELVDNRVVFRVVLISAARVNHAGDAQPIQLPHEVA